MLTQLQITSAKPKAKPYNLSDGQGPALIVQKIPMILDPDDDQLLPRSGRQKGRAAFMDLLPMTFWGGVISADIIEIDWNRCGCGRSSPNVRPGITRIPGGKDGDETNLGPASSGSLHAALHALTWGIG